MLDKIVNEISLEKNIDPDIVEKVIRSEFLFTKDTIEAGELQSVHLHYLGKFAIKPGRIKHLPENFLDNIYKSGKHVCEED